MVVREKIYALRFDVGHDLHELTEQAPIRIAACSIGDLFDLIDVVAGFPPERFVVPEGKPNAGRPDFETSFVWMLELLAEHLRSWDLESAPPKASRSKRPKPIPLTVDGVRMLDREAVILIIEAWRDAMRTVSRPLPKPSPDTGPPVMDEESIPMVPLSEPPAN